MYLCVCAPVCLHPQAYLYHIVIILPPSRFALEDMGCAKFATNCTYTDTGTPDYFAPEMVKAVTFPTHD